MVQAMTDDSGNPKIIPIKVTEMPVLVSLSKSKKLAQLASKNSQISVSVTEEYFDGKLPTLKPEITKELLQARRLIDEKIEQILSEFPTAKQNKLFNLRFGFMIELKSMPVSMAFTKLAITSNKINLRLLAELNYYGISNNK